MNPKIAILVTGDEILSGDLIDTNSNFFCSELASIGLRAEKILAVGDNLELLTQTLSSLCQEFDLVLMNGGLGPTADDYTSQAIAAAFNEPSEENPVAFDMLKAWIEKRGYAMSEANRKQARLPKNSEPILNETGSAPGISYRSENCRVYATPGVPSEMKVMWKNQILPKIQSEFQFEKQYTRIFRTFGIGESTLQQIIGEKSRFVSRVKLGFRATFPFVDVKSTFSESEKESAEDFHREIESLFNDFIVAKEAASFAQILHQIFKEKNLRLSVAESCTGGAISSMITELPGASDFFDGGLTVYSEELKKNILNVSSETLNRYGAVSEQTAGEMLTGIFQNCDSDYALATTGFAGPDKGTSDHPQGTVFIAWGTRKDWQVRRFWIPVQRKRFILFTSNLAADLLRRSVLQIKSLPAYSFARHSSSTPK